MLVTWDTPQQALETQSMLNDTGQQAHAAAVPVRSYVGHLQPILLRNCTAHHKHNAASEMQRLLLREHVHVALLLTDAAGVMELKVVSDFIEAGDHEVVICDVVKWKTPEAAAGDQWPARKMTPLYTGFLRREGYL